VVVYPITPAAAQPSSTSGVKFGYTSESAALSGQQPAERTSAATVVWGFLYDDQKRLGNSYFALGVADSDLTNNGWNDMARSLENDRSDTGICYYSEAGYWGSWLWLPAMTVYNYLGDNLDKKISSYKYTNSPNC
jgi:hypothetical protein